MNFNKLALAAAVAAAPATGMAMEPMNDQAMSGVTGQDGINLSLESDISASVKVHDTDGYTSATTPAPGAIVVSGFDLSRQNAGDSIDIGIDADGGGGSAYMNIEVSMPATTITLGQVDVAASGRTSGGGSWTTSGTVTDVMNLGTMNLSANTLNIQLGNEPQGAMIDLNTTLTGGLSITGFSINDSDSGGSMSTDLQVVDNGGTDLTVDTQIDIASGGLQIGLSNLGGGSMDVRMANLNFGDGTQPDIGDVEVIGLSLSGNLLVRGN